MALIHTIAGGGNLLGHWEGVTELGTPDFLLVSYPSPKAKVISIITEVISHQMRDVTLHCSGIVKRAHLCPL